MTVMVIHGLFQDRNDSGVNALTVGGPTCQGC